MSSRTRIHGFSYAARVVRVRVRAGVTGSRSTAIVWWGAVRPSARDVVARRSSPKVVTKVARAASG